MDENKKNRRSVAHLLINPPLQKFYAILIVIILVVTFVLIFFCIRLTIEDTKHDVVTGKAQPGAYDALARVNEELIVKIAWVIIPSFIVAGILGIYFIHRVAGPTYRLHRVLNRIAEGELPGSVKLRKSDFLQNLAGDLNKLLAYLRKERVAAQQLNEALEEYKRGEQDQAKRAKIDSIIEGLKSI